MMRLRPKYWLIFILILLVTAQADARKRRRYPDFEWGLRAGIGALYNDNLLRFSDTDIDRFYDYDPYFATPIETVDDFETEYTLHPSFRWRAPLNMMVDGYYNFKAVVRSSNPFTDYQTHSLGVTLRPRVRGYRWSVHYRVFLLPSYYLRVYRDRDYNEQDAARFRNLDHAAELSFRVRSDFWLTAGVGGGSYYYNAKFTEYDSEYLEGTLGARMRLPAEISFYSSYTRRVSDNVGKDQPYALRFNPESSPIAEDSEYGDADFNEDEFRIRVRRQLEFIRVTSVNASLYYRLRRRVYTTNRSLTDDPFHRSRLDYRYELSPSFDITLTRKIDLGLYFLYEERNTKSDYEAVIAAKDFVRREYGMSLTFNIR